MSLDTMVDRYIITTAQRGAVPHRKFLDGLDKMAEQYGAEILVLPTNGSKSTSKKFEDEEIIHPELQQYSIVDGDLSLHRHLDIRDFPVKAQQIDPLTGWGRFVAYDKSAIIASPKQRMQVIPNSNTDMPKVLMTTGAVTKPNYGTGNWATKAKLDHKYGAIFVEVDDDIFHYRQLQANSTGRFQDLNTEYFGSARPTKQRSDALVLGDLHTGQHNPEVMEASYQLIKELKPKKLIIHDLFDGRSISHHHENQLITKSIKSNEGLDNLHDELYSCGEMLQTLRDSLPTDGKIYVVKSNHDEVINRYLQEGRFAQDPKNLQLSCQLAQDMMEDKDPLEWGIGYTHGDVAGVKFLDRHDDLKVRGYQLSNHGDIGANGARGSPRSIENATGKSITGHSHTPHIQRDVWVVGTSTNLQMDYNRGASSWLNTHASINKSGKPQLINIIEGRYRSD